MFRVSLNSSAYLHNVGSCVKCLVNKRVGEGARRHLGFLLNHRRINVYPEHSNYIDLLAIQQQKGKLTKRRLKMACDYTDILISAKRWNFDEMKKELDLISKAAVTPISNNFQVISSNIPPITNILQPKSTENNKLHGNITKEPIKSKSSKKKDIVENKKKLTFTVTTKNKLLNTKAQQRLEKRTLCTDSRKSLFCTDSRIQEAGLADTEAAPRRKNAAKLLDDVKKTFKLFPKPKYSLNHVYITLSQHYANNALKLTPTFLPISQGKGLLSWECTYKLKWPVETKVSAVGNTKQEASTKAAISALHYLYSNNHITEQSLPIIPEQQEQIKQTLKHKTKMLLLNNETVNSMSEIVAQYHERMLPHLQTSLNKQDDSGTESNFEEIEDIGLQQKVTARTPYFKNVDFYRAKEEKLLPISGYKDEIIQTIKSNRVVIIKGEPGCGKSTRVPQYILESWSNSFKATGDNCNIIVTQPRRIAAISLAERVANERHENPGHTVGYQVRLKSNFQRHTGKLLYCTTGILLRRLQSDPTLQDATHVILDEAHERDVNTDLLLNLLKRALELNPKLHLLVMSATIKAEVFQEYLKDAAIIHVPGFTHPVKDHYLSENRGLPQTLKMATGNTPHVVYEDVARLLHKIHKTKPEGSILVFLPGWEDILSVKKLLPENSSDLQVLCLHSRIPINEQKLIFHNFPPGVRKIILATNIAETSVTIDDVVYVVDTGIHKEQSFDIEKGINIIDNQWISKASVAQRKGRAGRCQPGEAFLLYPKERFNQFKDYPVPEIQRTSLTKIVLDCKELSNNMKTTDFLGQLITPPEESAMDRAVEELIELDLLDDDENITSLGRVISKFQLEPKLAKALVNSVIYKCVTPMVDIVTYYSAETEVFSNGLGDKDAVNRFKKQFSQTSDHLAMMRMFEQWLDLLENDPNEARRFCVKHNILDYKLNTLQQLRDIHFGYLHKGLHDSLPLADDNSDSDELVKAVLLSGVGTVLQQRNFEIVKGQLKKKNLLLTRHNHKATISMDSVNHRRTIFPSNFMLYINETRSNIRRMTVIRETSLITPLTLLLFKNNTLLIEPIKSSQMYDEVKKLHEPVIVRLDGTNIAFILENEQAQLLQQCKEVLSAGVDYYVYQLTQGAEHDAHVNEVWDAILKNLSACLQSEAQRIAS